MSISFYNISPCNEKNIEKWINTDNLFPIKREPSMLRYIFIICFCLLIIHSLTAQIYEKNLSFQLDVKVLSPGSTGKIKLVSLVPLSINNTRIFCNDPIETLLYRIGKEKQKRLEKWQKSLQLTLMALCLSTDHFKKLTWNGLK